MLRKPYFLHRLAAACLLLVLAACLLPLGVLGAGTSAGQSTISSFFAPAPNQTADDTLAAKAEASPFAFITKISDMTGILYGFLAGMCICGILLLLMPRRSKNRRVYTVLIRKSR